MTETVETPIRRRRILWLSHLLPWPPKDIRPIVHESMVYVCPMFDGGGTKLKKIDAMAMGKAIVAHPVAEMWLRLLDDPELRTQIGHAARTRVEQVFGFNDIRAAPATTYATLV